jgi:hypothetical protein
MQALEESLAKKEQQLQQVIAEKEAVERLLLDKVCCVTSVRCIMNVVVY